jgi:hypothetical protein
MNHPMGRCANRSEDVMSASGGGTFPAASLDRRKEAELTSMLAVATVPDQAFGDAEARYR